MLLIILQGKISKGVAMDHKILLDTIKAIVSMHNSSDPLWRQVLNTLLQALPFLAALGGLLVWRRQIDYKHTLDIKLLDEKLRTDKEAKKYEIEMENKQKWFDEKRTLAKEALTLAFQFRDAVLMVRAPMVTKGESMQALKQVNESLNEGEVKETNEIIAAYSIRWKNTNEVGSKINLLALQLEPYFGAQGKKVFDKLLNGAGRELFGKLWLFMFYQRNQTPMPEGQREEMEQVIYGIPNSEGVDAFGDKVQAGIKEIEDFYSGYLRNPETFS